MYSMDNTTAAPVKEPRSNFILSLIAGLIVGIIGAIGWGAFVALSNIRVAILALLVGVLVGAAIILAGRGKGIPYGLMAAMITLASLLAGNLLSQVFAAAKEYDQPIGDVIQLLIQSPDSVLEALKITMTPLNLIFTAAAVFVAFSMAYSGKLNRNS